MLHIVEKELLAVPQDWCQTVRGLCSEEIGLKAWLEAQEAECVVFVGDSSTEALGHWSARTFGLVSKKNILGLNEDDILSQEKPELIKDGRVLVILFSRTGGRSESLSALEKISTWTSNLTSLCVSARPGVLTKAVDRSFIVEPSEHTGILTYTPSRFLVASICLLYTSPSPRDRG